MLVASADTQLQEECKDDVIDTAAAMDATIAKRAQAAADRGNVLRYMITIDGSGVRDLGCQACPLIAAGCVVCWFAYLSLIVMMWIGV